MMTAEFKDWVVELAGSTGVSVGSAHILSPLDTTNLAAAVLERRRGTKPPSLQATTPESTRRYIVGAKAFREASAPLAQQSLLAIHNKLKPLGSIVRSAHENGTKVVRLNELEAAVIKERFSALVVEEDHQCRMAWSPLVTGIVPISVPAGGGKTLTVEVTSGGAPVPGCLVQLFPTANDPNGFETVTDVTGKAKLTIRTSDNTFERVVVPPLAGYWSKVLRNVTTAAPVAIQLTSLSPKGFDWGHVTTDASRRGALTGQGLTVAVIDSGVAPHPNLKVTDGHNHVDDELAADWGNDSSGHGTHCAGVIAGLVRNAAMEVWGYVPDAKLIALRVFGGADGGGFASNISEAIDNAVAMGADVISMSFENDKPNSFMRQSIENAAAAGVLCIAAAGNLGRSELSYPAKYRHVVGVSAIGQLNAYPTDSIHSEAETKTLSRDGRHYLASFSNYGEDVDLCAPGVAITSTYRGSTYAACDGTSMACPHVSGIAALVMQGSRDIQVAPRDAARTALTFDRLQAIAMDLGLSRDFQGGGVPLISKLQ